MSDILTIRRRGGKGIRLKDFINFSLLSSELFNSKERVTMYFPMRYPFSTKIALLQQCVTLLVLKLDIGTILTSVWKKSSLNNNVNAVVLGRMYRSMLSSF